MTYKKQKRPVKMAKYDVFMFYEDWDECEWDSEHSNLKAARRAARDIQRDEGTAIITKREFYALYRAKKRVLED